MLFRRTVPKEASHTNSRTLQVFSKELGRKGPFTSSRAALLISEDTGLLASSFIFTKRESFLTQRKLGSFCCRYLPPAMLKIQRAPKSAMACCQLWTFIHDHCVSCIYWQRAAADADTFQISLFQSIGPGLLSAHTHSERPLASPFIPSSKYLIFPPVLTKNSSL